jgi:DNA-directed RNA polymerase specialized sigma24 family protein
VLYAAVLTFASDGFMPVRIAFVLVAVEGLSLAEAAAQIGESAETVKQRVLRARRELIALMDDAERHGNRGTI